MTVQDITELSESEIIGVHRNLKPFRAKRMDWWEFSHLKQRTQLRPPYNLRCFRLDGAIAIAVSRGLGRDGEVPAEIAGRAAG
jgi:hypothetical protein